MKKQEGFILIKLMIVVAIIGVLAFLAIPTYQNDVARAQVSEALTLASGFKSDMVELYKEQNDCPTIQNYIATYYGLVQTKYIDQVSVEYLGAECALVFKFNTIGVAAGIGGKHIALVMNQLGIFGAVHLKILHSVICHRVVTVFKWVVNIKRSIY